MKNSLKMKEQRATLVEELQATVDLATSEERDFTEAEEARQSEIHSEVKSLDEKIAKAEETEKILLRNAAVAAPAASEAKEVKEVRKRFSITKAMSDIINKGGLEGVEAEMCQEGRAEMARLGKSTRGNLTIPSMLMTVTQPTSSRDKAHTSRARTSKVWSQACVPRQSSSAWVPPASKLKVTSCCQCCRMPMPLRRLKVPWSTTSTVTSAL